MGPDEARLFDGAPRELALYEAVRSLLLGSFPGTQLKAHKTQISFSGRYGYAFVSLPYRRVKNRTQHYIILSFGLGYEKKSPRIEQAVAPRPGRWTHHFILSDAAQLDEEVVGWLREAFEFSQR